MTPRITRTRPQAPPEAPRVRRVRPAQTSAGADAKPPVIGGRVTRSRAPRTPKWSTEALNAGDERPYFLMDWDRALSWKFSIFIVSSFLYYQMNRSIITDSEYDRLAQEILAGYNDLSHIHKHLVTIDMLEAGTAFSIREYPRMITHAAYHALDAFRER